MARNKKKTGGKARGASGRGQQTPARSPKDRSYADYDSTSFTLRDAARNSESGYSRWNTPAALNLRHQTIGFVRANDPEPAEKDEEQDEDLGEEEDLEAAAVSDQSHNEDAVPGALSAQMPEVSVLSPPELAMDFAMDTPSTSRSISEATRALSPAPSNSSDDVVLFKGKGLPKQGQRQKDAVPEAPRPLSQTRINSTPDLRPVLPYEGVTEVTIAASLQRAPQTSDSMGRIEVNAFSTSASTIGVTGRIPIRDKGKQAARNSRMSLATPNVISLEPHSTGRKDRRRRNLDMSSDDAALEEVLDDYVANMRESGAMDDMSDLPGMSDPALADDDGWASEDIADFDDISTSDEIMSAVQQILSKRDRPSGVQYLVVWANETADDARWIPHAALTMDGAAQLIKLFDEKQALTEERARVAAESGNHSSENGEEEEDVWGDEDDLDEVSSDNEDEDWEDERDLIERRAARLSDEKLAQLLAKQEELGLGSEELVLFDGMFADGDELDDDLLTTVSTPAKRRKRDKARKARDRQLDIEMLDGEDYGDFDITDRPWLQGVKGDGWKTDPVTWQLSDSDEAQQLRDAWSADRKKKSLKKQEREELRRQGLLGKKNKLKADLNVRYSDGIDINQIGTELEAFLFSDYESRALPPMDKSDRKLIHEIAHAFGLKSMSKGAGRARFPVIYKTSRTIPFDDVLFARVRTQLGRRFFPRMDKKFGKGSSRAGGNGGGGGPSRRNNLSGVSRADTSYREGEVVGATAPELGADNRGRAMLEKMGWSMGTALGALNNKGILQPVAHVVKNSRAGLG